MLLKKRFGLFIIVCGLLAGCARDQSAWYHYFLYHPQTLAAKAVECQSSLTAQYDTPACAAWRQVVPLLQHYLNELLQDQRAFGAAILQAQMQLASVQQQLALHKTDALQAQAATLDAEIAARLAAVRLVLSASQ